MFTTNYRLRAVVVALAGALLAPLVPLGLQPAAADSLVSITVTPVLPSIAKGTTQQFVATGHYILPTSDKVITTSVIWSSSNTSVATISNTAGSKGLATAVNTGTSNITATLGSVTSAPAVLNVTARPPLTITPSTGPRRTAVRITNGTFNPGASIRVKYKTGMASPRGVLLCTTTARADGTIDCNGQIPGPAKAGANGAHTIVAKDLTTKQKQTTTYTLTP